MSNNQQSVSVKMVVADPSAIGLFGLAMVTFVASSQKLGFTHGTSFIIPWAIFLGAAAQLIACLNDLKHNNHFGATAFGAYSLFWISVGMSWMVQNGVFGAEMAANADVKQLGMAFIGYLIFSLFMTIGAMETNKVLFSMFALINVLLLALALNSFGIAPATTKFVAGITELIIALIGFYGCAANVLNTHFGKVFLPIGKPFGIFK